MEKEKAKAIQAVGDKYEAMGIKSEKTNKLDEAYRKILENLPMDD